LALQLQDNEESGERTQSGQKTLQFSQLADSLFFAIVSLNGNGCEFDVDLDVVNWGIGYWRCGAIDRVVFNGGANYQAYAAGSPALSPMPLSASSARRPVVSLPR
jgi:hypothetical protein